jgi:hypothetical protein
LQWTAPPADCPDAVYIHGRIAELLGPALPGAPDRAIRARGRVDRTTAGFRLDLVTRDDRGEELGRRAIDAAACRALADATALVLAMAINPARVESAGKAEGAPPVTPSAETPVEAPAEVPSRPPAELAAAPVTDAPAPSRPPSPASRSPSTEATVSRAASWHLGAAAFGVADAGLLPKVGLGAGVGIGLGLGPARAELSAAALVSRSVTLEGPEQETGGRISARIFAARVGYEISVARAAVVPMVGLEVASLSGIGVGVSAPLEVQTTRVALAFGGVVRYALADALGLRVQVDLLVAPRRIEFYLEERGDLHRTAGVGGRAAIGLDLRL